MYYVSDLFVLLYWLCFVCIVMVLFCGVAAYLLVFLLLPNASKLVIPQWCSSACCVLVLSGVVRCEVLIGGCTHFTKNNHWNTNGSVFSSASPPQEGRACTTNTHAHQAWSLSHAHTTTARNAQRADTQTPRSAYRADTHKRRQQHCTPLQEGTSTWSPNHTITTSRNAQHTTISTTKTKTPTTITTHAKHAKQQATPRYNRSNTHAFV